MISTTIKVERTDNDLLIKILMDIQDCSIELEFYLDIFK